MTCYFDLSRARLRLAVTCRLLSWTVVCSAIFCGAMKASLTFSCPWRRRTDGMGARCYNKELTALDSSPLQHTPQQHYNSHPLAPSHNYRITSSRHWRDSAGASTALSTPLTTLATHSSRRLRFKLFNHLLVHLAATGKQHSSSQSRRPRPSSPPTKTHNLQRCTNPPSCCQRNRHGR